MSHKAQTGILAKRYALAFLNLGLLEKSTVFVGELRQDLDKAHSLFKDHPELFSTLCNETLPRHERKAVLDKILEQLNLKSMTRNFLCLLIDKQRLRLFNAITKEFSALEDEHSGTLRARLKVAAGLPAEVEKNIVAEIERKTGKKVQLEVELDKNLLGGIVAQVGHVVIDGSLRHHLNKLKQEILSEEFFGPGD